MSRKTMEPGPQRGNVDTEPSRETEIEMHLQGK